MAITQGIEHIFRTVAGINECAQRQKPGTTFHGMKTTENSIQQVFIFWIIFQFNQLFRQLLEDLSRLDQKVLQNVFVHIKAHATDAPRNLNWTANRPLRLVRQPRHRVDQHL